MNAHPHAQRGFALIVVLWIITLLALQVSVFNLSIRDAGALAGNELAIARGEALAAAGLELAAAQLMPPDPAWPADGRTREVSFGGARIYITVTDEAGRFDINEVDDEVLEELLRRLGGSKETLAQWVDRNGPLLDPTGLGPALGLSADAVQPVARLLTVHGGDGKINPMVASREALLMLPGVDPAAVDRALELRQRGGDAAGDVAQALGSVDKWLTERKGPAYRIELTVRGESEAAIGMAEAVVLLVPDKTAPFRVLSWRCEASGVQPQRRN